MTKKEISTSMVHKMPADLRVHFASSRIASKKWEDITPLARNEWLCWILSAKKKETRAHRINRTITELIEGKRRPCCWAGCIHRS